MTTTATTTPAPPAETVAGYPIGAGWRVMTGIELAKLRSQPRVRIALGACVAGPLLVAGAMAVQSTVPADTLFGRWIHESGWALPLVVLGFSSQWVLPILVGIVAGDVAAGEDHHGTWSLLLSRSRSRPEVLAGKVLAVLAYSVTAVVLLAVSATVGGLLLTGAAPLVGLSGATLSSAAAFHLVIEAWAAALAPTLALAAISILCSVISRNSWVGVIGPIVVMLALTLVAMLSAIDPIRPFLPTTGFDAWHGFARPDTYLGPFWQSLAVSAGWIIVCLIAAMAVLVRRDVVER